MDVASGAKSQWAVVAAGAEIAAESSMPSEASKSAHSFDSAFGWPWPVRLRESRILGRCDVIKDALQYELSVDRLRVDVRWEVDSHELDDVIRRRRRECRGSVRRLCEPVLVCNE